MTGKRVLYQEPQATFFHDVMTNLFTDKMTKAATYYNLHPSNSELMSWGNNAPKIKDLLQLSGVTDTYVTFEYLVPYNMKRIDCILYGRNSQNQGNVVHIELKQWDNKGVRDTDCEGNFNVDDEDSDTAAKNFISKDSHTATITAKTKHPIPYLMRNTANSCKHTKRTPATKCRNSPNTCSKH